MQVLLYRNEQKSRQEPTHDSGIDVWAVGIVAYELMLGGPPFEGDTKEETCDKILFDQPFMPSSWSEEAKDFLSHVISFCGNFKFSNVASLF